MKTPSDELFAIIKSLDTQEKVQFKMYASRRKIANNYIKLFDAIDKQKIYDEESIKKIFKNEPFIKNLDRLKPYLKESILKCMNEYHSSNSIDAALCGYIQQIEFLINKKLFDSAKKLIAKADKLALEHFEYYFAGKILSLKLMIITFEHDYKELNRYLKGIWNEGKCADVIKNNNDYNSLHLELINISHLYSHTTKSKLYHEIKKLLKNPLLQDEGKALSLFAKGRYYAILGHIYKALEDWEKAYINYKKLIELREQYSFSQRDAIENYLAVITNILVCISELGKEDEFALFYNKAKYLVDSATQKKSVNVLRIFYGINNKYIKHLLLVHRVTEALKLSEETEANTKKYCGPQALLIFRLNFFSIYFYLNNYRKALEQLNYLLNTKESDVSVGFNQVKIFNLILHYELGNLEILPNLCRSASRQINKKREMTSVEKLLINFFGKSVHKEISVEQKKIFTELKKNLKNIPASEISSFNFDILSWVESKIENRPFLDVMKEKRAKNSVQKFIAADD